MAAICRAKPVSFRFHAPLAKRVNLGGSFNNWNTRTLLAKKDNKGNWMVRVNLKPGRYEYKFLVDGSWMHDPSNPSVATNTFGTPNSVIEIR